MLQQDDVAIRLIDLYCVKPVDAETLKRAAAETPHLITVEDHFAQGGLADAVREALSLEGVRIHSLAVRKKPKSGSPRDLLDYEEIGRDAIVRKVRDLIGT
jgi:transketolase